MWLRHSVSASVRAYSAAAEARAMAASRSARAASRCSSAESFAIVLEEAALPACSCASLSRRSLSRALAYRVSLPMSNTQRSEVQTLNEEQGTGKKLEAPPGPTDSVGHAKVPPLCIVQALRIVVCRCQPIRGTCMKHIM